MSWGMRLGSSNRVVVLAGAVLATAAGAPAARADTQPVISVPATAAVTEGSGTGCTGMVAVGTSCAVVPIAISPAQSGDSYVRLSTVDSSAKAPDDYAAISPLVTIPGGATSVDVEIEVADDDVFEGDQHFTATLSGPYGGDIAPGPVLGTSTTTVTIHDDDAPPTVSVTDAAVTEGATSPNDKAKFTVNLSRPTELPFEIPAVLQDGTATVGTDYQALGAASPIPFAAGPANRLSSVSVPVSIVNDTVGEPTEQFTIGLQTPQWTGGGAAPAGATGLPTLDLAHAVGTATIADDDPAQISLPATADVAEGGGVPCPGDTAPGMTCLDVPVSMSVPQTLEANVRVSTQDGTAKAPGDYTQAASTLVTFPAGQTSADAYIPISDDNTYEGDQVFSLRLSAPVGGDRSPTLGNDTTTITLHDNDAPPTISIGDGAITGGSEGTGGSGRQMIFAVSLSRPTEVAIQGSFDVLGAPDDPSLSARPQVGASPKSPLDGTEDYIRPTSTSFTIPALPTNPISTPTNLPGISIIGDSTDETNETLAVRLHDVALVNPVPVPTGGPGLSYGTQRATGTIVDDDGPTLTAANATVAEGPAGTQTQATVIVQLSAASPQDITVNYSTSDGTATAGSDYEGVTTAQTLTIRAGLPVATIPITVNGDDLHEGDETFKVTLSGSVNAGVSGGTATVTITDDDTSPALAVASVRVPEGTGSTSTAQVGVTLAGPSATALTVGYATHDGTATAGSDYQATNGSLTFNAGETSKVVSIPLAPDSTLEDDETFTLTAFYTVTDGSGATVADPSLPSATGTVTIADDDLTAATSAKLSIRGARVIEGDSGTQPATFTVSLDAASPRPIAVHYATADGSAKAQTDYLPTAGTVTFAPGQTSQAVDVPVVGDTEQEGNEEFRLVLSNAVNAQIATDTATGVITDNDVGGGPVAVGAKKIAMHSLLCVKHRHCSGLPVRWTVQRSGTITVKVTAKVPAKQRASRRSARAHAAAAKPKKKAKSKKKAKPKTVTVTLVRRSIRVRHGSGHARIRRTAGKTTSSLERRLRAAHVKSVTVTISFTNSVGAQQQPVRTKVTLKR